VLLRCSWQQGQRTLAKIERKANTAQVWDGKDTLFDFNFLALGVTATECFELAHKKELAPGRHHKVHFADHWTSERTVRSGPSPR
jgi:hypothetical protein